MSGEVRTDKRGRVTIPKEVRNRYGEKFRLVELDSGIKLVPIPDDPLEELRAAASNELREASLDDLEEAVTRKSAGRVPHGSMPRSARRSYRGGEIASQTRRQSIPHRNNASARRRRPATGEGSHHPF